VESVGPGEAQPLMTVLVVVGLVHGAFSSVRHEALMTVPVVAGVTRDAVSSEGFAKQYS
jgi:hypothetical protein